MEDEALEQLDEYADLEDDFLDTEMMEDLFDELEEKLEDEFPEEANDEWMIE